MPVSNDYLAMDCEFYRQAVSARIDGEDTGLEAAGLDGHLAGCRECRAWAEAASRVTRAARIGPADPVPDLTESIIAALAAEPRRRPRKATLKGRAGDPSRRPPARSPTGRAAEPPAVPLKGRPGEPRRRPVGAPPTGRPAAPAAASPVGIARLGLLMVGLAQLCLAVPALLGDDGGAPIHIAHEQGSWFLALAVGILVVAWRPARAAAMLPLVAALVVGLAFTMALDISAGRTQAAAEAPHGLALLGLGFLWVLAYPATLSGHRNPGRARPA